jgi:channel protein (hemolysin III family)
MLRPNYCNASLMMWSVQWLGFVFSMNWLAATLWPALRSGGLGGVLSAWALLVLPGASFCFFGGSLLYHAVDSKRKRCWLLRLERASIFVLSAGCITPVYARFLLVPLGWAPLFALWAACMVGARLAYADGFPWRSRISAVVFYAAAATLVVRVGPILASTMPVRQSFVLLLAAFCFAVGTACFSRRDHLRFRLAWSVCSLLTAVLVLKSIAP